MKKYYSNELGNKASDMISGGQSELVLLLCLCM